MSTYENRKELFEHLSTDRWFGSATEVYPIRDLRFAGLCEPVQGDVKQSRDYPIDDGRYLVRFNRDDDVASRMKRVSEEEDAVVLIAVGSYAPLHKGHIELMSAADRAMKDKGYTPIAAVFSLQSESHVKAKVLPKNPNALVETNVRISAARSVLPAKINGDTDVFLDVWDAKMPGGPRSFTDGMIRISKTLEAMSIKSVRLVYVFGSDNAVSMRAFARWGQAVCVVRPGAEEQALKYSKEPALRDAIRENRVLIVKRDSTEDISSTMIRDTEGDI